MTDRSAPPHQPLRPPPKYIGSVTQLGLNEGLSARRLSAYLEGSVRGFRGPVEAFRFEGGQSNPTYLLKTSSGNYVLRSKPAGTLLASAHAVEREFRVSRALFDAGFPVPEPLVLCEDEEVIGNVFYLMRHVPGRVFWDSAMPDLSADERKQLYNSMSAILARLHTFDYEAAGLGDFGRPGNYFARQIARWSKQYAASRTLEIPEMEQLIEWLPGSIPEEQDISTIIHGDFSFHNVLVSNARPEVAAVIDWELSTVGHPLGDLTYHLMEWYRPPGTDDRGTLRDLDLIRLGIPSSREHVDRYLELTGFSFDATNPFYKAFNLFRVAAILQGIAGRVRDSVQTSSNASSLIQRIEPLARAAWGEAKKAGAT